MNTQISPYIDVQAYHKWLQSVQVGDVVQTRLSRGRCGEPLVVGKITKTQIHIGPGYQHRRGYRFRRSDGEAVGSSKNSPHLWISPAE